METNFTQPKAEVSISPLKQQTLSSEFLSSGDESSQKFHPLSFSSNLSKKTFLGDFSQDRTENMKVCSSFPSPKSLKKTFQRSDSHDFEQNSHKPSHIVQSTSTLRSKFFQDMSGKSDEGTVEHGAIPPIKSVQSIIQEFSTKSEADKSKTPPALSPKPSRRQVLESRANNVQPVNYSQNRNQETGSLQHAQNNVKEEKSSISSVTATTDIPKKEEKKVIKKPLLPSPKTVKKVADESIQKKNSDKILSSALHPSPKFLLRRKLFETSSRGEDGKTKSRSVPASPKMTLRQFWRDYSPSSEEGGSDTGMPTARSKCVSKTKKSKGLDLFAQIRRKLQDVGIPGIKCEHAAIVCSFYPEFVSIWF